jgi:TDG/mug DNA glycosylase family protein
MIAYKTSKNAKILFVGINPHPGSYRRGVPFSNNKMFCKRPAGCKVV